MEHAIRFDGIDDYLQIEPTAAFPPSDNGSVTIELWLNINAQNPGSSRFLGWGAEARGQLHILGLAADGDVLYHHWGPDPSYDANLEVGKWYHVAAVHDAADNTDYVYVNGELAGSTPVGSVSVPKTKVILGRHVNYENYCFNGLMDEVRIWNLARSQEQIRSTMNVHLATAQPGLAGCWGFDEGDGTTASDASGNVHHGLVSRPVGSQSGQLCGWFRSAAQGQPLTINIQTPYTHTRRVSGATPGQSNPRKITTSTESPQPLRISSRTSENRPRRL